MEWIAYSASVNSSGSLDTIQVCESRNTLELPTSIGLGVPKNCIGLSQVSDSVNDFRIEECGRTQNLTRLVLGAAPGAADSSDSNTVL
jgi:hypothetical protein